MENTLIRGKHKALTLVFKRKGVVSSVEGNIFCWINLYEFVTSGLSSEDEETADLPILRHWNEKEKRFGTKNWSDKRVQTATILTKSSHQEVV